MSGGSTLKSQGCDTLAEVVQHAVTLLRGGRLVHQLASPLTSASLARTLPCITAAVCNG